jgi:hypothetical protein
MNNPVKAFLEQLFVLAANGIALLAILFVIGMVLVFISGGGSCSRSTDYSDYPYRP